MKVIASILAFLLTATVGSAVTCVGWEASPVDRHACCLRAHHAHSSDQAAADDCCARHEQGRQSERATRPAVGAAAALVPAVWLVNVPPPAIAFRADIASLRPHPPDLFSPPLRI